MNPILDGPDNLKRSLFDVDADDLRAWSDRAFLEEQLRHRFITAGSSIGATASDVAKSLANGGDDDADDAVDGDFEDLETGQVHQSGATVALPDDVTMEEDGGGGERREPTREELMAKKAELKRKFAEQYDAKMADDEGGASGSTYYDDVKGEMDRQAALNRQEFEDDSPELRAQFEGYIWHLRHLFFDGFARYRPGSYVRLVIRHVPCEFVTRFDPHYPVIVGALLAGEDAMGLVQVRLKKHRWHKKVLKNGDPLVISCGWRRFQSVVMFSLKDDGQRNRLLKYTPEHMHCNAIFYGNDLSIVQVVEEFLIYVLFCSCSY